MHIDLGECDIIMCRINFDPIFIALLDILWIKATFVVANENKLQFDNLSAFPFLATIHYHTQNITIYTDTNYYTCMY